MKLFEGFNPEGKSVRIILEDGRLYEENAFTGDRTLVNDEHYSEDDSMQFVKLGLMNDGYRFCC